MPVITYDGYEAARFSAAIGTRREAVAPNHSVFYAGLSPFDIPHEVVVEIRSGDECTVFFRYPNDEPPETSPRLADDTGIRVVLGRNSKKVLSVIIPDARVRFESGEVTFDRHSMLELALSLPSNVQRSCERSITLTYEILRSMPRPLRRAIAEALGKLSPSRG